MRVGPCLVFYGDPTQAAGAGMLYLGDTRGDVTFEPNVNIATGRTDQKGMTPLASGVYVVGPTPVVSVPLLEEAKATLEAYILGSTVTGTSLGFGSGFEKIAEAAIGTLCLLPADEAAQGVNGIDAPDAIWLPAAVANGLGAFTFNLPEGDDVFNPRDTQFIGCYREADHGAAAIPAEARVAFVGPPSAFGLGWSLPAAG